MRFLTTLFDIGQIELIIRLIVAAVCGYIIGYERKNRKKEAGIRTHIIVAIASCLMMEISKYGFADSGKFDGARLAAQVVSGIGFLGAGTIFVHKNTVKGLTTAAGIWATSGIGMAIGAGMYVIGVVTAIIIFVLQIFFHKHLKLLNHISYESVYFIIKDTPESIAELRKLISENTIAYDDVSVTKLSEEKLRIDVMAGFPEDFDMFDFSCIAAESENIFSVCSNAIPDIKL